MRPTTPALRGWELGVLALALLGMAGCVLSFLTTAEPGWLYPVCAVLVPLCVVVLTARLVARAVSASRRSDSR